MIFVNEVLKYFVNSIRQIKKFLILIFFYQNFFYLPDSEYHFYVLLMCDVRFKYTTKRWIILSWIWKINPILNEANEKTNKDKYNINLCLKEMYWNQLTEQCWPKLKETSWNLILEILDNNSNRRLIKLLTEESGVERAEPGPRRIEFHFCARLEKPSTSETVAGRSWW
jgi:hypothetical protein